MNEEPLNESTHTWVQEMITPESTVIVLNRSQLGAILPPPPHKGCWEMSGDLFVATIGGAGCYLHLAGRGQGCCPTPYNAQDDPFTPSPTQQFTQ